MVAFPVSLELQVTDLVISREELLEKVPVALNCFVLPENKGVLFSGSTLKLVMTALLISIVLALDMLGHYSIQMTVDVYGHLVPSENREAVNSLDEDATNRNLSATTNKTAPATS